MKKTVATLAVLAIITSFAGDVFAQTDTGGVTAQNHKGGVAFTIPAHAVEVRPDIFSLGEAYDSASGKMVEGYAIVHKKDNANRPDSTQVKSNAAKSPRTAKCYALVASGAKWKTVEDWEVFGGGGLDGSSLRGILETSIGTWETAAANTSILGSGSLGTGPITNPNTLDDRNQVSFGDLGAGTIAVTIFWGRFSGPVLNREIIAWDQIYNTDFSWTTDATLEPSKMDFWNIATHELGHAMGLADIYDSSCSAVTMFGYGTEGETQKRDLTPADITGINLLY